MTEIAYLPCVGCLAFGSIGAREIVLILLVVLLLFGGRKLPELARGIGKGLREFRRGISGIQDDLAKDIDADEKTTPYEENKGEVVKKEADNPAQQQS